MTFSFFNIIFAVLGLGFLIFIHELGHYFVARLKGMKVEAFSIGFGKAIYSWKHKGVTWQIGILPFGGYVKIAGMQKEGTLEPHEIRDGFYEKSPWNRIQVAMAGPLVNIGFAMILFLAIWSLGGREKNFSEFTHRIGWVDPTSVLYEKGVRPGDVIQQYDGRDFRGMKDLLIASAMNDDQMHITGYKIDALSGLKTSFNYTLPTYENPYFQKDKLSTIGILSPASYLINQGELPTGSPMLESGILPGDRLLWVDGDPVFSLQQLSSIVNDSTVFLTVERDDEIFQTKVPRVHVDDLKMSGWQRGEVDDWQHEAGIRSRLQDLSFIPYSLSPDARVEHRLDFIDENDQVKAFQNCQRCSYFNPLQEGDKILAVDGQAIHSAYDLLRELQTRRVLMIVERSPALLTPVSWKMAESEFENDNLASMRTIASSIGTNSPVISYGNLHLLRPVTPVPSSQFMRGSQLEKSIDEIKDPQKKTAALKVLETERKQVMLGLVLRDRDVMYNPNPFQQLKDVFQDTWRTLSSLLTGSLSPKYTMGPIGIVTVMQYSWFHGAKEAIYWMALISLNLGIMNLLPIPVLDGGHIVFSLWEMIFKRRIPAKIMERLVVPFVGLLLAFFIFVTFHDISRLFK
jgi:regulator of sigma E protease